MIDNDKLLAAIDAAKANAYGTDDVSTLGARRARAIEAYLGLNTNPAPEGRSQVVDRSVYETMSVMLPSLVRIFATSSEEVCKFEPVGPDDEQAAEQTTSIVNYVVTAQNQWQQICADWIHDAMLLCNGYAIAYWDETESADRETYEGQSDDQMAALLQDESIRVIQHSQTVDKQATAEAQQAFEQAMLQFQQTMPQWEQAAMQAQQQGQQPPPPPQQPQPPEPIMLHDLVIERVENEGQVCIKVLPPEHCSVSQDTPDWTLKECPYFEFRQGKTIAELKAMGLDVPEDVSDDEEDEDTDEDDARNRFSEDEQDNAKGVMRVVQARMIWVRCDPEDDGIARLYYVIAVGRTVFHVEPVSRIPVASMTAQPLPHRHIGMSVAETVMDIQDVKTAVKRGGLDNLYLANNGRHAVSSKVNLDDFLDARPGGVIRMLDDSLPSEGHIMPIVHPMAFEQIIGSLEYFEQERQNRTGASRYFSGTDAGAINKTASGTMALQNMAAMRVEHIARTMAPAVEYLFSIVHELVAKHQNKALTIKLTGGQWATVDPQAWRNRRDVRISVGVGAGNRESMMQQLGNIFGAQMQLLPLGLAQAPQLHATMTEMAKLAGFANPSKFWVDPQELQQQPPQPSPEQVKAESDKALKEMELQADAQKFQAESQLRMQEIERQSAAKLQEQRASLELQASNDARDAERERQKMIMDYEVEQKRLENERYKAELDAQTRLTIASISAQASQEIAKNRPEPRATQ